MKAPYANRSPSLGKVTRAMQAPQDPEDQRSPRYDGDHANDWVRGANEDATAMPNFDHSPKRMKPYG